MAVVLNLSGAHVVIDKARVSITQEPAAVEIIEGLLDDFDPTDYDYSPNVDLMIANYLLEWIDGEIIEMDPIEAEPGRIY